MHHGIESVEIGEFHIANVFSNGGNRSGSRPENAWTKIPCIHPDNFEAQAEFYADDAITIAESVLVGKEAILNSFKTFHEQFNTS